MRKFVFLFLFILAISSVSALRISGKDCCIIRADFKPNYTQNNDFFVGNAEGYTSNYEVELKRITGADLREYFTVTPSTMENVKDGENRPFNVRFNLPDQVDIPGESETWVRIRVKPTENIGGIAAVPSLVIRYLIFVLYPYRYISWELNAPNLNINETKKISIDVNNLGEPTISKIFANITILDSDGRLVRRLKTNTENNVLAREARQPFVEFSSVGLDAGNYKAYATLNWDSNSSAKNSTFKVGTKEVNVINLTKRFEIDSINKMFVEVSSNWNTRIDDIYANIYIIDDGKEVKRFKSLNSDLNQFETKRLDAYFDTNGLERKEYGIKIILKYEGIETTYEDKIMVDENINAEIVEEMPNAFNVTVILTPLNIMIFLILIFLVVNMYLLLRKVKKEEIDPAVLEKVNELKKTYSDSHIKEMMMKKGWEEKKIDQILQKLR